MKANLTEFQTRRIAQTIYSEIYNNWWEYVNKVMKTDDDTELSGQDFINVSKALAEMLQG